MQETILTCDNCKVEISPVEIICENCGYPIEGTKKEQAIFIGQQISNKSTLNDAKRFQRRSSYILYVIGGFQIVIAIVNYYTIADILSFVITAFIGLIFILFGFLSSKKPLLFLSLGLTLIVLLYAIDFILDPSSIFQGILWKLVILGTLSYALIVSFEEQKIKRKNKTL